MRCPATAQFGGDTGREDLMPLELGIVVGDEGIVGIVGRGTRGERGGKCADDRDPVRFIPSSLNSSAATIL